MALWALALVPLSVVIIFAALSLLSRRGGPPGLVANRLHPCPSSPNCVCSQDSDAEHRIEPIAFQGTEVEALERLLDVLRHQPRVRIAAVKGHYVHAEFTSAVFRFIDDVEFLIDGDAKVVHVRSASRVGYSDFGANRRRVEELRMALSGP